MKKTAIKIAASTAVAASAFVAVAPAQQADAATNVNQLATNAQNAGTVLKWAISVEGSADYKTLPTAEYNAAKAAVKAAETAAAKLSATEKLSIQAKLVEPKTQITRAMSYIDAINSSTKIIGLTNDLNAAIKTGDLGQVETAYHKASFEFKTKQAKLLDRVYGQSTRDGIRNAVKPAMEASLDSVKYDVTVKMHLDKASALIKESKFEEAAAELAKADYNLKLKDAKFTFKTQLEKSYEDTATSLPLMALSAAGDGKNTVTVKFSKEYKYSELVSTLEAGQFKINGLTVQSAKLSDDKKTVTLTTSTQKAATEYTVTWQGKTVKFTTAAVADTTGIAVNETDVAYKETTESRTYTAKLTNTDGTPYVGRVTVKLNNYNPTTDKVTGLSSAVLTTVNGQPLTTTLHEWTGVTDSNGNLVYTIAAERGATKDTVSVTNVQPNIEKLDGDKKNKDTALTHFFHLQTVNIVEELDVTALYVSAANDYVYAEGSKYKWDANDAFFIRGQKVSQEAFETALSNGDTVTVDYKVNATDVSTWNITKDVTLAANTGFTNPKADVRFDGYNYDLSGKGQAGNTVKVYRGNDLMGTTVINSDGTWTLRAVNLTQDAANVFKAFQFAPGKDGNPVLGTGNTPEHSATATIFEGAFKATKIILNDQNVAGLSVNDTLDFTFLNNDKLFGHVFKKDLEGTITVSDNLSRKAVYNVEYVDADTLKIVKVVSSETGFVPTSATTIESATGVVNQDELALTKSSTIGSEPVTGPARIVTSIGQLQAAINDSTVSNIVLDSSLLGANVAYAGTYTVSRELTINGAGQDIAGVLTLNVAAGGNLSLTNAQVDTVTVAVGGQVNVASTATVSSLSLAGKLVNNGTVTALTITDNATIENNTATLPAFSIPANKTVTYSGTGALPTVTFASADTSSLVYGGATSSSATELTAVGNVLTAEKSKVLADYTTAKTNVDALTDANLKSSLLARLVTVKAAIDAADAGALLEAQKVIAATSAVVTAEGSPTSANHATALALVNGLQAGAAKDGLVTRLAAVQTAIDLANLVSSATAAVNGALANPVSAQITTATTAIGKLPVGNANIALLNKDLSVAQDALALTNPVIATPTTLTLNTVTASAQNTVANVSSDAALTIAAGTATVVGTPTTTVTVTTTVTEAGAGATAPNVTSTVKYTVVITAGNITSVTKN